MQHETVTPLTTTTWAASERPISVVIVAMGGQGGGVLTGWIVRLAESQGWVAQATSVPGVAQRTGSTIYYVEMMQPSAHGQKPVLAQMPTPGDVDVVIASEYMEAGRSILRGIVTPDRTTLIASCHRSLATSEKMAPGDSIADSSAVATAIGVVARREICFDMNALAVANGSVISAALFGSLAASGVLPFSRSSYEEVIQDDTKGVNASLRTFEMAFEHAQKDPRSGIEEPPAKPAPFQLPAQLRDARANALLGTLRSELPEPAHQMAYLGLQKVVDFQDPDYGREYLDVLTELAALDRADKGYAFTATAAKYLANAMTYDDLIRIARLKTRSGRRDRVATEVDLRDDQILHTTEYMHPRLEELVATLPSGLARWITARHRLYAWLDRRVNKGRRVRTYTVSGFVVLYCLGGLKHLRRRSFRHQIETTHREAWLSEARAALDFNYDLAVAILGFQRLVKGYSDTHRRGLSKFDKVMSTTRSIARRPDAAAWANRLLTAAIQDASDEALDGTIKTIDSFLA